MSGNTFTKSTKYTVKELESYVADPNACVQKLEWTDLISVLPKYLGNIREGVKVCLTQKIGTYDRKVDGIILAFKNTKILSPLSAIRPNSVRLHIKIRTDFYVFRPFSGAAIEGTVHYVSTNYLSAVIYRVFNVTIKLQTQKLQNIARGSEISFIVKSFDMKSDLPYIEGELIKFKEGSSGEPLVNGSNTKKDKITTGKTVSIKREKIDSDTIPEIETAQIDEVDSKEASTTRVSKKLKKESHIKKDSRKRKHSKSNGHNGNDFSSADEMEHSISAILSGLEKELDGDSPTRPVVVKKEPEENDVSFAAENSSSASKKKKKKKKTDDDIDLMQAQLLLKIASEYNEEASEEHQKSVETTAVKVEPVEEPANGEKIKKKKKKKKSKTHDEDDFEASIMSSILKCAAEVDEDVVKEPPPSSKKPNKTPRKSVRFDETITEASFNAFDASELLEISQLQAPSLSSTLKDPDQHK